MNYEIVKSSNKDIDRLVEYKKRLFSSMLKI